MHLRLDHKGEWKTNEISSWFHKDDIPWVLGIIPSVHKSDWITWSLTNNGQYSVASGYKLRFQDPELAAYSNNDTTKAWWKFVWGSKMKNFIWKVFNNWIPAKTELKKRGIELNTICDWCKSQHEDIYHALWGCPNVQGLWEQLGFSQLMPTTVLAADDFLWWLWKHMEKEELLRFIPWTTAATPLFLFAISRLFHGSPPPSDFHLINTDASLKLGHLGCGLSAIIRNPAGDLVVAEVKYIHGCMTVPMAEAAAIHLGVQLAVRWSINKAWVGSDCITLIQAAANNSFPPTDWGQLMKDIINGKNHFKELNFIFYPRVCNKVANSLARWSLMTQKSITMTKMLPSCAAALLIAINKLQASLPNHR
ncbi:hypothetical protein F8388_007458 [Cannabis sativa]|uniref:Reverse transcriptase zinc-binding domain-containing protein n=1 Tax=Cannabis sativa TaxID=3483 RepID=A0A7J6F4N4_CANSA|nr:hypothetical protein F8388_007458 [Cannabis sativa]KAF4390468.1 hypothetical protein G4B88_024474 [Cannabis sativa]